MIWSLPRGKTALHLAVEAGNENIVEMLLHKLTEENINVCGSDGKTALHLAVEAGNVKMFEILLHKLTKKNINVCDSNGKTPVFYAIENERWIIANVGFLIVFWSVVL